MLEIVHPAIGQTVTMTLNDVLDNDSLLVFSSEPPAVPFVGVLDAESSQRYGLIGLQPLAFEQN